MPINVPNILTLMRVLSIPIIIYLHNKEQILASFIFLCLALLTDFFDGHLARKLKQETNFGAIFDPIADKLVALGFYTYIGGKGLAPWWFVGIILLRNFSQLLSVPILIWWLKKTFYVKPTFFAKTATAVSDFYLFVPLFMGSWWAVDAKIIAGVMILIAFSELFIFVTYVPRLLAIAQDRHDTFT